MVELTAGMLDGYVVFLLVCQRAATMVVGMAAMSVEMTAAKMVDVKAVMTETL
jgi:hypothetical protein